MKNRPSLIHVRRAEHPHSVTMFHFRAAKNRLIQRERERERERFGLKLLLLESRGVRLTAKRERLSVSNLEAFNQAAITNGGLNFQVKLVNSEGLIQKSSSEELSRKFGESAVGQSCA